MSAALDAFVARFRAAALSRAEWTHTAHLRVGAWHVHHHGAEAAGGLLRTAIRALNERHGTPNSATSGYHETITVAYVQLIAASLTAGGGDAPLATRVEHLLASPLAQPDYLLRFWSRERLMSARARAEWVPPDLAPLRLSR
ncbi:MAG: hypothetical protein ACRERC_07365 [Candidatus Binatia bacterium]